MMKYNFILPLFARVPSGGSKVMYEYASRLAEIGHDVQIYNSLNTPFLYQGLSRFFLVRKIVSLLKDYNRPKPKWFAFNNKVRFRFINTISDALVRDADVTVFTWWSLAKPISQLNRSKGVKINLIQDYEIWQGHQEKVKASYSISGVHNIVISYYLKKILDEQNYPSVYIPNAIDEKKFGSEIPILHRSKDSFLMLYSQEGRKDSITGISAFVKLKERADGVQLSLFGVVDRPKDLPEWIQYYKNPQNIADLYKKHRVFVSTSISEGWGLPMHEAMASGCVAICTNIVGHHQFIENNASMITYLPGDSEALFQKLLQVCLYKDDDYLRASQDNQAQVSGFRWENSVRRLEEFARSKIME